MVLLKVPFFLLMWCTFASCAHNFTPFEDDVLPAWLARFTVDHDRGAFSFLPLSTPSLYGSVDVIHTLATTGRLTDLGPGQRSAWAGAIGSYQRPSDGYYEDDVSGNSRYHAMGEATAALSLLGQPPRFLNSDYEALAEAGPAHWQSFYDGLYFNNCTGVYPCKVGCGKSIHSCGQVIGSVPSVLAYTTGKKHARFLKWWASWLAQRTNPGTGTLCPVHRNREDMFDSLGGGMATHGILLGIAHGDPANFPFELSAPAALLSFSLGLQNLTEGGVWIEPRHEAESPVRLGSISLDGIFQAVRSSEQLARHGNASSIVAVRSACDKLLGTSARQLNNKSLVLELYGANSHQLPNVVAAVGECARAFPSLVVTRRKWSCCARYV